MGSTAVPQMILAIAAAWVLALGFDLLLDATLLAKLYVESSPLGSEDVFGRNALEYLALLVLTVVLYLLLRRLGVRGATAGFQLGAVVGAVAWAALGFGFYPVSTTTIVVLAVWWIGQAIELGLAGAVLGALEGGVPLGRIWAVVGAVVVVFVVGAVVLRSLGLALAMEVLQ